MNKKRDLDDLEQLIADDSAICLSDDDFEGLRCKICGATTGMFHRGVCVGCWIKHALSAIQSLENRAVKAEALAAELEAALRRMVDVCARYLEEQPVPESELFNPDYVNPLAQARAVLAKKEGLV